MKKKIIALTIATAICAATFSVAGCSKDKNPGAMSEDEWKAAWQATYEITNFTMKGEQNTVVAPSIEVSKTDFENNNYILPEISDTDPVVIKQDTLSHRLYIETTGYSIDGNNHSVISREKMYKYYFIDESIYYEAQRDNDSWSIDIDNEGYRQNLLTIKSTLDNLEYTLGGISLTESYSLFTYNNQTDAYEGTFTLNQNDGNSIFDVKFNFNKGKLSKFALDCVISSEIDAETLSVSHRALNYTISDIGNTVPITDEEMQMLKGLITE